jgi:hypothetical protein
MLKPNSWMAHGTSQTKMPWIWGYPPELKDTAIWMARSSQVPQEDDPT